MKKNFLEKSNRCLNRSFYSVGVVIVLLALISNIMGCNDSGKNVWDAFFDGKSEEIAYDLLDDNGQSYTIDDYTFTLEQTLYDNETRIGYLIFSILKENGKPEIELNKWHQCTSHGIGEENRFHIDVSVSHDSTFWFAGDRLYAYYSFTANEDDQLAIDLVDYLRQDTSSEDGYQRYAYNIKHSSHAVKYLSKEGVEIKISSLGIALKSKNKIEEDGVCITLFLNDGTEKNVIDGKRNIGTNNASSYMIQESDDGKSWGIQFVFTEIIDIEMIDCISFNGEILRE